MSQNGAIGFSAVPGGCGDSGFSSPAFVTWYCLVMWFVTLYFLVMLFVRWYCICHMVLPLSRGIILSHCLSCGIAFVTWFVTFYFLVTLFVMWYLLCHMVCHVLFSCHIVCHVVCHVVCWAIIVTPWCSRGLYKG